MALRVLLRFFIRTIGLTILIIAGNAQSQQSAASQQPSEEDRSAADASKQAANPLARAWLMQFQQNDNWVGMPSGKAGRLQSNLYFQPLLSVKVTENWTLLSRPVLEMFNSATYEDSAGQHRRVTSFADMALVFALSPSHAWLGPIKRKLL
jgi:hypothetical protein